MEDRVLCIVVVPIYAAQPSADERLALSSLKLLKGRYPICFAAPEGLNPHPYLAILPEARVEYFRKADFSSVEAYSRLTAGLGFYMRFIRYRHMLLIQTDAALLHGELEPWLKMPYSYIGAPWQGEEWLPDVQKYARNRWGLSATQAPLPTVGNGGASLRRIDHFIRARLRYMLKGVRQADWLAAHRQEDVFWTQVLAPGMPFFRLPDEETAARFALETQIPASGAGLPLAVHAFRKYHPDYWLAEIQKAQV